MAEKCRGSIDHSRYSAPSAQCVHAQTRDVKVGRKCGKTHPSEFSLFSLSFLYISAAIMGGREERAAFCESPSVRHYKEHFSSPEKCDKSVTRQHTLPRLLSPTPDGGIPVILKLFCIPALILKPIGPHLCPPPTSHQPPINAIISSLTHLFFQQSIIGILLYPLLPLIISSESFGLIQYHSSPIQSY